MKFQSSGAASLCLLGFTYVVCAYPVNATEQQSAADALQHLSTHQPLEDIRKTVSQFIVAAEPSARNTEVNVKKLDRRLRLNRCDLPLEAAWSHGSRKLGRVTVQVACSSPKPWRVHVQASVTMKGQVWTLSRAAQRGDVLTDDMLIQQEVTLGANNPAYHVSGTPVVDISAWLGFEFVKRVNSGKVLNERMLKPARLVGKGDAVVIRHRSRGLELSTRGVALSDAGADQQTQVRNSSSGKIIDVVVVSPGTVEILR